MGNVESGLPLPCALGIAVTPKRATEGGLDTDFIVNMDLHRESPGPEAPERACDIPFVEHSKELLLEFERCTKGAGFETLISERFRDRYARAHPGLRVDFGTISELLRDAPTGWLGAMYPIDVWFLPQPARPAVQQALMAFESLPWDDGLLDEALRGGALRLSVWKSFADILAAPVNAMLLLGWLREAVKQARVRVRWDPSCDEWR